MNEANWYFEEDDEGSLLFMRDGEVCATLTKHGVLIARSMSQSTDQEPTLAGVKQIQENWEELQQRMFLLGCTDDEFYQS